MDMFFHLFLFMQDGYTFGLIFMDCMNISKSEWSFLLLLVYYRF